MEGLLYHSMHTVFIVAVKKKFWQVSEKESKGLSSYNNGDTMMASEHFFYVYIYILNAS